MLQVIYVLVKPRLSALPGADLCQLLATMLNPQSTGGKTVLRSSATTGIYHLLPSPLVPLLSSY